MVISGSSHLPPRPQEHFPGQGPLNGKPAGQGVLSHRARRELADPSVKAPVGRAYGSSSSDKLWILKRFW